MWTARPPLLLNHLLQAAHWAAPSCSLTGLDRSSKHLCLFLSPALRNSLLHTSQANGRVGHGDAAACCSQWPSTPSLHNALQPALDVVASSYQLPSSILMFFKSLRTTSLHLFFGPDRGRGWRNHPKRQVFGILLSCIHARWPSHCNLRLITLSAAVSLSPHLLRTSIIVMCFFHCS